jgi:hypothetical protein
MTCCSEIFWNNLVMTASGILLAVIAVCYKSKCSHIRMCGLDIERNVEVEEDIDEMEMETKNNQA